MADDQTEITPDQPIPQGYAPVRTSATSPSGNVTTTLSYAPRTPIAPPGGSVPDLSRGFTQAFQNLPVDQAAKAVEIAMRYQGQRGYQRDLASGVNAAQAFAKWAPLMFHQATGIPEALERTVPPPISPQQLIQNKLNQAKFDAAQAATKQKLDAAKEKAARDSRKLHVLSSGEVLQETGDPDNPVKVVREKPSGAGADKDIDYQIKAQNLLPLKPNELPTDPSYQSRTNLAAQIQQRHPLKTVTTKEQYDALKSGEVYIGKDGNKYKKP